MRQTQLILVEGIPGSGKSTTSQFIAQRIEQQAIPVQWWYEEEAEHPLYVFRDNTGLQRVMNDLEAGRYETVIDDVLAKWRQLTERLQASNDTVVLESCLFGYLTWTLFSFDVSEDRIARYVARIETIVRPLEPVLIFLHQRDPRRSLRRICKNRGDAWKSWFIGRPAECLYGKHRGLNGFDGLVTYWSAYGDVMHRLYNRSMCAKLAIENSVGDWEMYQNAMCNFLDLPTVNLSTRTEHIYRTWLGTYEYVRDDERKRCKLRMEHGHLVAYDVPWLWHRNHLLPMGIDAVRAAAFPIDLISERGASGTVDAIHVVGREMLRGTVALRLTRVAEEPIDKPSTPQHTSPVHP